MQRLCRWGRGMAGLPHAPNTLAPRALGVVTRARVRPGLKLEARCTRSVSRYGDFTHAVQALSSAGLERRDAAATCPSVVAPDLRRGGGRPPPARGPPPGAAGPHRRVRP